MKKKKGTRKFILKTENSLIYRDEANQFNLSFRIRALDIKLSIGGYLSKVRADQVQLTQKNVAKKSGISVRNLINIETGYGASMDAVMQIFLFYTHTGLLSEETKGQYLDFYDGIWMWE